MAPIVLFGGTGPEKVRPSARAPPAAFGRAYGVSEEDGEKQSRGAADAQRRRPIVRGVTACVVLGAAATARCLAAPLRRIAPGSTQEGAYRPALAHPVVNGLGLSMMRGPVPWLVRSVA